MGPSDFVSALYGALLGDGHAAGGVQSGASSYVTLEWPGLPLDPQVFGNLWATDNPTGSPEALESFSGVVDDQVPAMAPLYQPAGISLEQVYSLILQATVATGPVANAFAAAQAKFAGTARGSLQNAAVQFHASTPVPRTWCDPAGDSGWTTITIGGDSAPAPPPPIALRPLLASASLMQWRVSPSPILAAHAAIPVGRRCLPAG